MARIQHPGGGVSRTKQADSATTDLKAIVNKYITHGQPLPERDLHYGDFTNVSDYHAAHNRMIEAQEQFAALPAAVRRHCENDPGKFLDLVFDPDRRGELEELGMVPERAPAGAPPAKEEEPAQPAEVLPPTE